VQVTAQHIAGQTDAQVTEVAFSILARSMRRGVPANILGVPLFGIALTQQGPTPGFFVWAALVLLMPLIYFLVITPIQSRLMAAGSFRPLGRLLIAFNVLFGSLWGLASVMYFEPETARLVVLIAALMTLTMTVCFACVSWLPAAYAFCLPMAVPYVIRAAAEGTALPIVTGLTVALALAVTLLYVHQFNTALLSSIRMRFENERLNEALTEQRVLERTRVVEAASRHKSEFLATVSHEIRTPMNAVIGMSGLLLDTPLNAEQLEYAHTIRDSGETLLTLINDILDFSKIEAGRMDIEQQPFDLRDCIESALDLVAARAAEKELDIAYELGSDVPAAIRGDVTRLRQILLNLFSNAVKFTDKGEVVLSVAAEGGELLHFTVRDSGIGLSEQGKSRMFQSFSQADSSTTRKYGGTGLGLAISKKLAELMGGTMWVESPGAGQGSSFHFSIVAPAAQMPPGTRRLLLGRQPALVGKRLLVVDDNVTNRRILALQTAKWGMTVQDTEDPQRALEILKGAAFDLAIVDMHMPAMDGAMLAAQIREAGLTLPLVLFSSLGRRETDATLFAATLAKPLHQSQLFDTLIDLLAHDHTPRASQMLVKPKIDATLAERHPLRILLAEDNVVNQKLALRLLQQMGYRADVAGNGIEAIESIERQIYDVVLMDVQMPEMDGLEASRRITARWPAGERPRIVAMTANAMQGDREECLSAGMDDYVTKPIRVDALVQALMNAAPRPGADGTGSP
jgi:signal transduction histidine kinase/DNA-binding response OmpR family regulator